MPSSSWSFSRSRGVASSRSLCVYIQQRSSSLSWFRSSPFRSGTRTRPRRTVKHAFLNYPWTINPLSHIEVFFGLEGGGSACADSPPAEKLVDGLPDVAEIDDIVELVGHLDESQSICPRVLYIYSYS